MIEAALQKAEDKEKGSMKGHKETLIVLGDELTRLEAEILRLRLTRERATYRLEQRIRERDRLARHLASLAQEGSVDSLDGAA